MQKGFAPILILVGMLVLVAVAAGAYYFGKLPIKPANNTPKACTEEAKICPDGSSVGRVGPNCEFTQCPVAVPKASEETVNWKTYTNTKYKYSFKYPTGWVDQSSDIDNQQNLAKFVFTEKSQQYFMVVGAGGRGGPTADEIRGDNPIYHGYRFSRRIWIKDDKPFFIVVIPDAPYSVGGGIEFDIPPENTQSYIETFDQILSTFKFLPATAGKDQKQESTEGQFCGGFAGKLCPGGFTCKLEGNYPDAGGKCVKD